MLVETGKGRRGEPIPTPLGWAYWTATGHETLRTIGNKIGLEPLTLYSMNRWHHKLKNYDIDQEFTANSKLSLPVPPFEDWETEYIAADRTKIFTRLLDRIDEVWPEVLRSAEPLRSLRREQLKTYPDSGALYRQLRETLDNAEAAAKKFNDGGETLRDVQQCRKQLVTRWHRDGFLLPDEIAFKADERVAGCKRNERTRRRSSRVATPNRPAHSDACSPPPSARRPAARASRRRRSPPSLARALASASEASDAKKPRTNAEIAVLAVGLAGLALGAHTADDALRATRRRSARDEIPPRTRARGTTRTRAGDGCGGGRRRTARRSRGATFGTAARDEGAGAFCTGKTMATRRDRTPRGLRLRKRERALMTIPDAAVVNWNTAAAHPTLGSTFESLLRRGVVDERLAVMCFFMIERRRGEESAWKEYIDSLPRAYDAPLSFSDEELERELSGTTVYAPVKAQKAHVKKMFEECVRPAMRELTQADNAAGSSLHMLPDVSEKEFAWAFQTFWSRALAIPVGAGGSVTVDSVVPGVDMVNHAPRARANARWEHVEDSSRPDGGYVALVSAPPNRTMKDGEEIFINYGDKSNEELLFTYGFALKDNAVEERMVFFPALGGRRRAFGRRHAPDRTPSCEGTAAARRLARDTTEAGLQRHGRYGPRNVTNLVRRR